MPRKMLGAVLTLAWLVGASPACGQTFPFQLRVQQGQNVFIIPNNAGLTFNADAVGKQTAITITATYLGRTLATIADPALLLGSADFTITPLGSLPLNLRPNESFTFDVQFSPSSSSRALAQLLIAFLEAGASAGAPAVPGTIVSNLTGVAPQFSFSYFLAADANVVPLDAGAKLRFEPTLVNTSSLATIIVANRGSGPGMVQSVSLSGSAFRLLALPLLPGSLSPGSDVRFLVRYSATQIGSDNGALQVTVGERTFNFDLEASAISSSFSYALLQDSGTASFLPSGLLTLPDTAVGERTSVTIRVRNLGNADGVIGSVAVSGSGFALADLPVFPLTLRPNDLFTFSLVFAPSAPGRATGRLRIGNDTFDVSTTGIGARLIYSYSSASATIAISAGGTVSFAPLAVGQTASLTFLVRNSGTAAGTIASIGVDDQRGAFRVQNLPALPANLEPEAQLSFSLVFSPVTTGLSSARLVIDSQSFAISGFGSPPPTLPAYRFTGAGAAQEPLQQVAVGLRLASPYALPLRGFLTITVDSDAFFPDPAVQFANGGRSTPFTIPANSEQAIFPSGAAEIRLQTGSVAGTITITPSFATQSGLDLTPESPEAIRLTVPRASPRLVSVQLASKSQNGFVLIITGFSTTRTLNKLDFQLRVSQDVKVSTAQLSINLEAEAVAWFRSTQSQTFGGQFVISLPFGVRSDVLTVASPADKVESVSVTASNELGVSNAVTAAIP